ncbi:MAG: DUF523 domain-containing protein [Ruminococcaceae bacterium]|nr:DUF523 domain-containing protein [Oscillospiraceae bacterium]
MNILISACLIGCKCRYDGKDKNTIDTNELKKHFNLFPVCPEVDGGLSVPRAPAEIKGSKVINTEGRDVTEEYTKGAMAALKTAKENGCTAALLKARSPSCGKGEIYDGSFSKTLTKGNGILVRMLSDEGIAVYTENEIDELIKQKTEGNL